MDAGDLSLVEAPGEALAIEETEAAAADEDAEGPFEIADVVARIDAFWRHREEGGGGTPTPAPLADHFRFETDSKGVFRWVDGGVFPGLGLTSLAVSPDGGMQSEGLSLFAGQELRIEPELIADMTAGAKIGVRLIDYMVERGRIDAPQKVTGPDGQPLRLEPSANGRFIRVWRG